MSPREAAAYNAGAEAVRQMAMAAVTMESRDDASDVRKQAAVAALSALAEGARALIVEASVPCSPPDDNRDAAHG
jgi:hypothetical protein